MRSGPLVTGLLAGLPLLAQSSGGLRVEVRDGQGKPAAGVPIQVQSLDRGEQRVGSTNAEGVFSLGGLLPGAYRVNGVEIRIRSDERALLRLKNAAEAEVAVTASPLEVETSSVATQTAFTAQDLERLPFAPHRYVEHGYLAPGVTPSGRPEPVVLGSLLDANAFLVDGLPTNLASTGRFGLNLSTEILESQVLTTGGHKAEVGFASGGVYALTTKSGTNTWEGALFHSRIWRGLNASPKAGRVNQPDERPTRASEYGFSTGGPLVKDRLFLFAAFNRQLLDLDFENVAPFGQPPHQRSQSEDRSYRFAKLTAVLAQGHRLEFSYFGDPVTQFNFDAAGDARVKDDQTPNRDRGGDSYLLKHVAASGSGVWESHVGLHRTSFRWTPATPSAGPFRGQLDAPGSETFGRYGEDRREDIENLSLRSEVTRFVDGHTLKAGLQILRSSFTVVYRRPSSGESYLDRAAGGAGPSAGDIAQIRAGLLALHGSDFNYAAADSLATASPVSGQLVGGRASYLYQRSLASLASYGSPLRQHLAGLFLQDDWALGKGWVANLGLRIDRAENRGEDGRTLYQQTLLSPRLGLSLDPRADGSTRVFAYAGRIYSPPSAGSLAVAGATTGGPALQRQVWIPSIAEWRAWQSLGIQSVRNAAVDSDLRAPKTDLVQLGVERVQSLPWIGAWVLEATLTQKRVRDLIDTYNPAFGYFSPADPTQARLINEANASASRRVIANLPGLKRDFRGLDLVAHRRFEGGHRLQFSYSQGDLEGNSEVGNVNTSTSSNTGFASIPSLRQDYRASAYAGPLNEEVKHLWKAFGTFQISKGLEGAFAYVYRIGLRYSALRRLSGDNVLVPGTRRGEQELPHASSLDVSIAWQRAFGRRTIRLSLEALNLLNRQPASIINNVLDASNPIPTPANHQQGRVIQASARIGF